MKEVTLEELLEAGCHFGHQVTRQNPKAREFIFEARDNIHIIDLVKTKEGLESAILFIKDLAAKGGSLLVIGTKRQAKGILEEEIERAFRETQTKQSAESSASSLNSGLFYIINRWVGGILTNSAEVAKNYKKLKELRERLQNEEEKAKYTKKEVGLWEREKQKLEGYYQGVLEMTKLPDALFIIDTHNENLAVKEAQKMNVEAVGIVDTNADPYLIDYPIPANDDAVGSIKLITSAIIDAWIEGKKTAITEAQKQTETQKISDSSVARKTSKKEKSNKKPATTEAN